MVQPVLHVNVYLYFDHIFVAIEPKNAKYAFSGKEHDLNKYSLEPFTGFFTKRHLRRQRAELLGRLRMWEAGRTTDMHYLFLVLSDMLLFFRFGFTIAHVRRLWSSVDLPPRMQALVKECSKLLALTCPHVQIPMATQLRYIHGLGDALGNSLAFQGAGHSFQAGVLSSLARFWRDHGHRQQPNSMALVEALSSIYDSYGVVRASCSVDVAYAWHMLSRMAAWTT